MPDNECLSKEKFIDLFSSFCQKSRDELIDAGVIDEVALTNPGEEIDKKTVSLIIHNYMRQTLKISDLPDISKAYVLKDLFDCRVCANHIAQVYLRGIMEAEETDGLVIFNVFRKVSKEDALGWFEKIKETKNY